jgi:hypothetical protein
VEDECSLMTMSARPPRSTAREIPASGKFHFTASCGPLWGPPGGWGVGGWIIPPPWPGPIKLNSCTIPDPNNLQCSVFLYALPGFRPTIRLRIPPFIRPGGTISHPFSCFFIKFRRSVHPIFRSQQLPAMPPFKIRESGRRRRGVPGPSGEPGPTACPMTLLLVDRWRSTWT